MRFILPFALWLGAATGCSPLPCFGDACSCYGDPEAPDANAGCADCTPEASCDALRSRVLECGGQFVGDPSACEGRLRAEHRCLEGIENTPCDMLAVACASQDAACYAELVTSGATTCQHGLVIAVDGTRTVSACASRHCLRGECVECAPEAGWECPAGFACSLSNRCVAACTSDSDCGSGRRCFGGQCDPALGTPCKDWSDCGSLSCSPVSGAAGNICTELCSSSCETGSFCGCPSGFVCADQRCAPAP